MIAEISRRLLNTSLHAGCSSGLHCRNLCGLLSARSASESVRTKWAISADERIPMSEASLSLRICASLFSDFLADERGGQRYRIWLARGRHIGRDHCGGGGAWHGPRCGSYHAANRRTSVGLPRSPAAFPWPLGPWHINDRSTSLRQDEAVSGWGVDGVPADIRTALAHLPRGRGRSHFRRCSAKSIFPHDIKALRNRRLPAGTAPSSLCATSDRRSLCRFRLAASLRRVTAQRKCAPPRAAICKYG